MKVNRATVMSGLFGAAAVIVVLGLLAGGMSSGSPLLTTTSGLQTAKAPVLNTSQNYSFSANAPDWNTGNLCTPVVASTVTTCSYSGGHYYSATQGNCGCKTETPLTYNFSGNNTRFVVTISNLGSKAVYLNMRGTNDSFWVSVNGCTGGTLNITVMSQTTFTLNVTSSNIKAWIYLYSDADHYFANLSGCHGTIWTYFVSARPKYNECPASNDTKSDSYALNITGRGIYQGLVFVNGVGYSTPINTLSYGSWDSVSFTNTTNFECFWSTAPAPTCHHGWGTASEGAAVRVEE